MTLGLLRASFLHNVSNVRSTNTVSIRRVLTQRPTAAATARATYSRPGLRGNGRWSVSAFSSRREFNTAQKSQNASAAAAGLDPATSPASIEQIRLRTEFMENNDIREYLRKWQEHHSNAVDPVRGPGTSNASLEPSKPWVGNMLNDNRETHDAGSDVLRLTDADTSGFSNVAEEGEAEADYLQPGDLVALTGVDGLLTLAIYVRSVQKQQQFYSERGKWRVAFPKDFDYVVKDFAPANLVASLHPYFPDTAAKLSKDMQSAIEGGVPRSAGGQLLRLMNDFKEKVDEFYRRNAFCLDDLHNVVAEEDTTTEYTLEELASKAFEIDEGELDVVLFATHKAVRRNAFLINNDKSSLFSNHYLVQPKTVTKIAETVNNWVHEHQEYLLRRAAGKRTTQFNDHPMVQFLQKAQQLVLISRKTRSPTTMANVGPTSVRYQPGQDGQPLVYREVPVEKFNGNDMKILKYLLLYCIPPRQMTGSLRSAGSYIMRATGMYGSMSLTAASMPLFLQELGVISPWENLQLLDQNLGLPGHSTSDRSERAWEEDLRTAQELCSSGITDTMQDLRTDWGDLPIYCVDDPSAEEIDDGISLERVLDSNDTFWVRVHIANPSAFIPLESPMMQNALSRCQTLYVPERTYPILPSSLTQKYFSLASGRPTLTFSAKMNLKGDVLDTSVTNGIARNVIYITHDKLRNIFDPHAEDSPKTLRVGGDFTVDHSKRGLRDTLSEDDQETFHTLRKLMLGFREWRQKNGAMEWPQLANMSVSVSWGNKAVEPYSMSLHQSRHFLGDPVIQLRSQDIDPHEVPDQSKQNLVSLVMNLACWVAAKWCAERNIPTIYNGTWYHPEYPQLTNKNIHEYGGSSWLNYAAPMSIAASEPIPHAPLGLDAYVKATSPLRRDTDLVAHYQIEAALRFEKQNGRRLDASSSSDVSVLPLSKDALETHISRTRWRRSKIREYDGGSKQFWACLLLFRAFYFAECDLPETFTCLLHRPYSDTALASTEFGEGYMGVMTSLGVKCQILIPEGFHDVDILSVVKGRILSVDLSRMLVIIEATEFVKHFERVGEWK